MTLRSSIWIATIVVILTIFYQARHPSHAATPAPAPTCRVPMVGSSAVPATTTTETLLGNWSGAADTKLSVQRHQNRQAFVMYLTRGKDVMTCEFTVMWRPKFDPALDHDPYRAWCHGFGMAPGTPATVTFSYYQGQLLGVKVSPIDLYMEFFR